MENKLGLKETKELHSVIVEILDDVKSHREDDGKISTTEWIKLAMDNAPEAVTGFRGIDKIDDELKDLTDDEIKEVALMGVTLMKSFADAFLGGK